MFLFPRSGKSTYLQQVCLIVILAQVGCYVPARFSTLRVVNRMFTRMGAVDNLESNSSTVGFLNLCCEAIWSWSCDLELHMNLSGCAVHDRDERDSFYHAECLTKVMHLMIFFTLGTHDRFLQNILFDAGVWLLWMNLGGLLHRLMDLQLHGVAASIFCHSKRNCFLICDYQQAFLSTSVAWITDN